MTGGAEPALLLEVVHLDHHAVRVIVERVALGLEPPPVGDDGVEIGAALGARVHREAAGAQRFERVAVGAEGLPLDPARVVDEDLQGP